MKRLVVVRHGEYGSGDHLNEEGRAQMNALAEKLKPLFSGCSVLVLTSTANRARESAEILTAAFSAACEAHEILLSESSHQEDLPGVYELVRSRQDLADVVMLVTHLEYARDFPSYFGEKQLETHWHQGELEKGEAKVIDCEFKTIRYVV